MKKLVFVAALLSCVGYCGAEEIAETEETPCEQEDFCPMAQEEAAKTSHCRPRRQCHCYCECEDRDIDATWPGKTDDSFMEEMMR